MRIAVISDIHGHAVALEAVLADIDHAAVEQVVCLGDAIQGGAQPVEVVALLRERGFPVVMGNADAWLLSGVATDREPVTEQQERVRRWSVAQISDDDRAFIAAFQPVVELPLPAGGSLLAFHGSPASFDDFIFPTTPEEEVRDMLPPGRARLFCGGHTHLQQLRRLGDALFVNPGSIGLAYDHAQAGEVFHADPWAEYAIVTAGAAGELAVEFRRVPYDVDRYVGITRASGTPAAGDIAQRLGCA